MADRGAFKYELGKAQLQIDAARGYARDEFRDAVGSHQHLMAFNIAYDRWGELMLAGNH
ncbi:MAG: hypothetical protein ACKOJC_03725 [Actinomycetota bacterium]